MKESNLIGEGKYDGDIKHLAENTKPNADGFSKMIIDGVEYIDKEKAGKALLERCSKKQNKDDENIGEYRGFKLELGFDPLNTKFTLTMRNNTSTKIELGSDVYGNIKRIDNSFEHLETMIKADERELEETKKTIRNSKNRSTKTFYSRGRTKRKN